METHGLEKMTFHRISPNTTSTLWAYALALRDVAPHGRNVVYAGNIIRNCSLKTPEKITCLEFVDANKNL